MVKILIIFYFLTSIWNDFVVINQLKIHQNYFNSLKKFEIILAEEKIKFTLLCNEELMKEIKSYNIKMIDKNGKISKDYCYYDNDSSNNKIEKEGTINEINNILYNINLFTRNISELIKNKNMAISINVENKNVLKKKSIKIIPNDEIIFFQNINNIVLNKLNKIEIGIINDELNYDIINLQIKYLNNNEFTKNSLLSFERNSNNELLLYFNIANIKNFNKFNFRFIIIDTLSKEKSKEIKLYVYESIFYKYLIDIILIFILLFVLFFVLIFVFLIKKKKNNKKIIENKLNETQFKEDVLTNSIIHWNTKYLKKFKNVEVENIENTINKIQTRKNYILNNSNTINKNNELSLIRNDNNNNFSMNIKDISVIKKTNDPDKTNIYD